MTSSTKTSLLYTIGFIVLLLIIPTFTHRYYVTLLNEIIIFALFAVSFNLLLGYGGLLSFGHAMFFGIGSYAAAIFISNFESLSLLSAVALSVIVTALAGLIVGSLLLRHKGTPFALLTLAFNALFFAIAMKWYTVTGGDDGLSIYRPPVNLGFTELDSSGIIFFYYLSLLVIGPVILYCWYFSSTAMGRTVVLMRENEERMRFLGYNTNISRLILFVFTGALAGLAGAFYTLFYEFTSISSISIDMSTIVILMVVIGGTSYFAGPLIGTSIYIYLQDYLSDITDRWPFFMGLIFIFMILYVPKGLSGLGDLIIKKIRNRNNGSNDEDTNRSEKAV
jgi:branched-chain amino acid transport system permease protein